MAAINVNVQEKLSQAIFWGNLENVKTAIREGANVNGTDFGAGSQWHKPLLWAAIWGKEEIAIHLIQEGAVVNVSAADGLTPLHYAALQQKNELIKALISNNANINAQKLGGPTPLHLAAEREGPAMDTLIELGAQQDLLNGDKKTAAQLKDERSPLNAERIERGVAHENAGFWERVISDDDPAAPAEVAEQDRNAPYNPSRGCGG